MKSAEYGTSDSQDEHDDHCTGDGARTEPKQQLPDVAGSNIQPVSRSKAQLVRAGASEKTRQVSISKPSTLMPESLKRLLRLLSSFSLLTHSTLAGAGCRQWHNRDTGCNARAAALGLPDASLLFITCRLHSSRRRW